MTRDKCATAMAVTLSVPVVLFASFIEFASMHNSEMVLKIEGYQMADMLYLFLGYPLTRIIFIFAANGLNDNDNWWGIPLLDALFICQWIVWARLLALLGTWSAHLGRRFFSPSQSIEFKWPEHVVKADGRRFRLPPRSRRDDVRLVNVSRRSDSMSCEY